MPLLELKNVSKTEREDFLVQNISFTQNTARKIAIAGATGSGKTTLLKLIAGLMQPTSGEIFFDKNKIKGPDEKLIPGHEHIAYLSQHFELRSHYRVAELLEMASVVSIDMLASISGICKISHLTSRYTHQLSGGERQRIALAILLGTAPKLLLLDEPYSNLDAIHKHILKQVVDDVCSKMKINCLLVSHDAADVLSWADEIIVLQDGKVLQQGTPQIIFNQPANEYCAALFGAYNVLTPSLLTAFAGNGANGNGHFQNIIRPSKFLLSASPGALPAQVIQAGFVGNHYQVLVSVRNEKIIIHTPQKLNPGSQVFLTLTNDETQIKL